MVGPIRMAVLGLVAAAGVAHGEPFDGVTTTQDTHGHRVETVTFASFPLQHAIAFDDSEVVSVDGAEPIDRVEHGDDGQRTGLDDAGHEVVAYRVVDGELEGRFTVMTRLGVPVIDGTFHHGVRDGMWREFHGGSLSLAVPFVAGVIDGTVTMRVPGAWSEEIVFHEGARVGGATHRAEPRTLGPPYAWNHVGFELAGGPVFGERSSSVQTHFELKQVNGTATSTSDGRRANGGYFALGGDMTLDVPFTDAMPGEPAPSTTISLGFAAEVGWATARYEPDFALRDVHLFARAVPYVTVYGDVGARVAVGFSAPAWPRFNTRDFSRLGECPKHSEDGECMMLLAPIILPMMPVLMLDHVEVIGELDPEHHPRLGFMIGWGM